MNSQHEHDSDVLQRRVDSLPRETAPSRDLWPAIAARLASDRRLPWHRGAYGWRSHWASATVAMAAGYLLATWLPLPWPAEPPPEDRQAGLPRLEIVQSVRPALAQLPPKTRAVVEADLSGLEQDWLSIEAALALDPDNPLLLELHMNAEDRAASVRDQVNRLTSGVAEGLEI
jgi:hypothetical protein